MQDKVHTSSFSHSHLFIYFSYFQTKIHELETMKKVNEEAKTQRWQRLLRGNEYSWIP